MPYIPIAKARGFTAGFGKIPKIPLRRMFILLKVSLWTTDVTKYYALRMSVIKSYYYEVASMTKSIFRL